MIWSLTICVIALTCGSRHEDRYPYQTEKQCTAALSTMKIASIDGKPVVAFCRPHLEEKK